MTFTYSDTDISTSLAKVRLLLDDTDSDDPLLTDEEINYFLDAEADVHLAAYAACEAILAKLARHVDRSNLGLQSSRSQKTLHYQAVHAKLKRRAGVKMSAPFVGGSTTSNVDSQRNDSSLVQPAFKRGQGRNNG